jgi:hypothetical protein
MKMKPILLVCRGIRSCLSSRSMRARIAISDRIYFRNSKVFVFGHLVDEITSYIDDATVPQV